MNIPSLNVPIVVLAAVFILIAIRQIGNIRFQIWQVMLGGAATVLLFGGITPAAAVAAINLDVMIFLFAMFVVGQGLEESGYLAHLSYQYFKRAKSLDALVVMVLVGGGIASAFLMNDTLAIIGTPVMLLLARKHNMSPKPLLLALAFSVTIGSVMSPIGNPQNLLIAIRGNFPNPFATFLWWLFIPTLLNLSLAFLVLKAFHLADFHDAELRHSQEPIRSHELAFLSKISLRIVIVLVLAKILTASLGIAQGFQLTHIAIAACLPILIGSSRRWGILRRIDWHTLVFFAAMFVVMESVWQTGFFQNVLRQTDADSTSTAVILGMSVVLSQFVSNVPLVALALPLLTREGATEASLMALAAGSTVAGNLLILGAASNVIIIQNAEKRSKETLTFPEFARVGAPLTLINVAVYWGYFSVLGWLR